MPDEDELEAQLEEPVENDEDGDLEEGTGEFLDIEDGDLTEDMGREADEQAKEAGDA